MDYEKAVEDFYVSILNPGDYVIDCGAHSGRHTIPMARRVGSSGHVFAFEPLPSAFAALKNNLSSHSISNATIENIALGEVEGQTQFVYVPEFPEYSGFKERVYHDEGIERTIINVPVLRLENKKFPGKVKYIKIDAEGGDLIIMRGARGLIEKHRPFVTFELGDNSILKYDYKSMDYYDFFAGMEYDVYTITGAKLSREALVESSKVQSVWDYVAAPREGDISMWPALGA
ncbi:MAG: FkbM family methyltransferase [Hoeflea sp.]|nr:FkbM family methyltransferase [Hoeflea sp.]